MEAIASLAKRVTSRCQWQPVKCTVTPNNVVSVSKTNRPGLKARADLSERVCIDMANYYGTGRSNYFKVKSVESLQTALKGAPFEVLPSTGVPGEVCILARDDDGGGYWSYVIWAEEPDEEDREVDVPELIASHLEEGQVAVFVHAGAEKLRYLHGYSVAVHSDGRQVRVDLDDVYERASAEFGIPRERISHASY